MPGWKSLPFAGPMSHWLYSDGHFYLVVYLPDPPGGMSSSAVAAVLLRPIEVVVHIWTTLLRVWRAKTRQRDEEHEFASTFAGFDMTCIFSGLLPHHHKT